MTQPSAKNSVATKPVASPDVEGAEPLTAPNTYTFDNRSFVVQPVYKDGAPATVSSILLRLMRADLEKS